MLITCDRCNKKFERVASAIGKRVFCSLACRKEPLDRICEGCNQPYTTSIAHRKTSRFCSKSCAKSGERHHFYGKEGPTKGQSTWIKGLTKETDSRVAFMAVKVSQMAQKRFEQGLQTNSGNQNPNFGKTRVQRTPEQLERYSKAAIERVKRNQVPTGKHAKHGYYKSPKTGLTMYYRSSLELRFMTCLDSDVKVTVYWHEPFSLKMETGRRYLPDFKVEYSEKTELIEVKPKFQIIDERTQSKAKTGIAYCQEHGWEYRFVTLEDIKEYEQRLNISST